MADCFCDWDPPIFYHKETHKARKKHRCIECGRGIAPGETYERVGAKWDGKPETLKTCCRCVALREHIKAHVRCFCWAHRNLLEDARAEMENLPAEALGSGLYFEVGRLAVAIRRAPRFSDLP